MHKFLKRILSLISTALLIVLVVPDVAAQKLTIVGIDVFDKVTRRAPTLVSMNLYSLPDTTEIGNFNSGQNSAYEFRSIDLRPGGKYLLKVDNPDLTKYSEQIRNMLAGQPEYAPQWVDVVLPNPLPDYVKLPDILVSRPKKERTIDLDEVTVKASRILFYHKGDTLVFNADAFILAEGTMLDGLVAQLPGVEIKENGQIFCNGRFVDNLLLNGRDLFNGDKELMLENLAAYTVKNIAVYDQQGRDSKLLGSNAGDTKYVMDVRLKRDYLNGWIANAESGVGTSRRYMGRLFGMWYTDNASISAYANVNNLNDRSQPGREGGAWAPDNVMDRGVEENTKGGMTYTVSGPERIWDIQGSVKYERSDITRENEVTQQNYFDSGDTYLYGWNNLHSRDWSVSTDHLFEFTIAQKLNLMIKPQLKYEVNSTRENNLSGSFFSRIDNVSRYRIEEIYNSDDSIVDYLINRNIFESLFETKKLNTSVSLNGFIPLVKSPTRRQTLRFSMLFDYTHRDNSRFNRYTLNYRLNPNPGDQSYQYFDGTPDNDKKYDFSLTYAKYFASSTHLDIEYKFAGIYERRTSLLYLLNKIAGFDAVGSPIGTLPSWREYAPAIDAGQSYETILDEYHNTITPKFITVATLSDNSVMTIDVGVPITVLSRSYDYLIPTSDKSYHISPMDMLWGFRSMLSFGYTPERRWQSRTTFNGSVTPIKTDLYDLIEIENTTDPLNIYTGNSGLRNALNLNASLHANFWKPGVPANHTARLSFARQFDQFAKGVMYNPDNGVRTIKPYNINGNWLIDGAYDLFVPFGKYRKFDLTSTTSGSVINSVDYIGSGTATGDYLAMPPKQQVRTYTLQENVKLNWQTGRHRITLKVDNRMNHSAGVDSGFAPFTSWTGNFGGALLLNLPKGWSMASDVTLYVRRGFTDYRLNTTDVIWNARLSKSLFKGKLLCMLDGYDLLHQLQSISYTINSQARTEMISNVIPSYILLHLQWNFNKQPKKAKE